MTREKYYTTSIGLNLDDCVNEEINCIHSGPSIMRDMAFEILRLNEIIKEMIGQEKENEKYISIKLSRWDLL